MWKDLGIISISLIGDLIAYKFLMLQYNKFEKEAKEATGEREALLGCELPPVMPGLESS